MNSVVHQWNMDLNKCSAGVYLSIHTTETMQEHHATISLDPILLLNPHPLVILVIVYYTLLL